MFTVLLTSTESFCEINILQVYVPSYSLCFPDNLFSLGTVYNRLLFFLSFSATLPFLVGNWIYSHMPLFALFNGKNSQCSPLKSILYPPPILSLELSLLTESVFSFSSHSPNLAYLLEWEGCRMAFIFFILSISSLKSEIGWQRWS